jgi:hypothetical protein
MVSSVSVPSGKVSDSNAFGVPKAGSCPVRVCIVSSEVFSQSVPSVSAHVFVSLCLGTCIGLSGARFYNGKFSLHGSY